MKIMLKRLIGFWRGFFKVIFSKKKWCWPRRSEVLILDGIRPYVFKEYLKPWNPEVLYIRGEQFNIPVFISSFFKPESSFFKPESRINAYMNSYIEKVRPRLIVTFTDNYLKFYAISKKYPDITTLFVQNGLRGYYFSVFEVFNELDSKTTCDFFVDYMLVFGSHIGEKYSECIAGETVIMGSMKNNMVRKEESPQKGVIALVSQYRKDDGFYMKDVFVPFKEFWTKPDSLVVQCLQEYAKNNNKRLMIIPAGLRNPSIDLIEEEKDYYKELMGEEPEFFKLSGPYAAYQAIDSAEIVVALDSTLGVEAIARGTKAAILPIRGSLIGDPTLNFGWPGDFPDEGLFWTNNPNPESFVRILDYLHDVDYEQWRKDVQASNFSSILVYDPGNSIFKKTLDQILGAPNSL
tara:strand:- start:115 stop:1332 length:1218 start_codon:yes stop_codon:yes gene_type:complete